MLRLIGVPIDSVGRSGGTEHSPRVLRALGLAEQLAEALAGQVTDSGDLDVSVRGEDRDPTTGVVAWPDVAAMSDSVTDAVAAALRAGTTPIVVGGCCALEPAAVAAAAHVLGRVGLVHVDGHLDVYDGRSSPTGEAADMPTSVLLGLGPQQWSSRLSDGPVVAGSDVVVVGHRDPDELVDGSLDVARGQGVLTLHADSVHADPTAAGQVSAQHGSGPVWVHLDVDVLDEAAFPATDYLLPGGLTFDELRDVLLALTSSGRAVGFSLGCYNPDKDSQGKSGRQLVDLLVDVLPPMVAARS
jgi:arginase